MGKYHIYCATPTCYVVSRRYVCATPHQSLLGELCLIYYIICTHSEQITHLPHRNSSLHNEQTAQRYGSEQRPLHSEQLVYNCWLWLSYLHKEQIGQPLLVLHFTVGTDIFSAPQGTHLFILLCPGQHNHCITLAVNNTFTIQRVIVHQLYMTHLLHLTTFIHDGLIAHVLRRTSSTYTSAHHTSSIITPPCFTLVAIYTMSI